MNDDALQAIARALFTRRLTVSDWRLLGCIRMMQAVALAAVACAPIPAARRMLGRLRPWALACAGDASEARILWAIEASSRWRAATSTCLTRALAADWLLGSHDAPLTMVIGVARPHRGSMRAHAWLERNGRVIVGAADTPTEYLPLVAWNGVEG